MIENEMDADAFYNDEMKKTACLYRWSRTILDTCYI